jgi:hypothetical protein
MGSCLKITPERVIQAHNVALARQSDNTGEINDPNLAYSIGVAVGEVFGTSGRCRSQKTKDHRQAAKNAVWRYHKNRILPFDPAEWERHPTTEDDVVFPDNIPYTDPSQYVPL